MDKEAKTKTRRKDTETRDFKCLCGKTYLSYAAAYTHAKNKHQADRQYIEGISKPQRQQLKRGRPKEKKPSLPNGQTARLNLIQSTILRICELIEGMFSKTILEGNEERSKKEYDDECRMLQAKFGTDYSRLESQNSQSRGFLEALIKDFNEVVAARVWLVFQALESAEETSENLLRKLETWDLWEGRAGINEVIFEALREWKQLMSNSTDHCRPDNSLADIDMD